MVRQCEKTDELAVGKVRPRFLSCVLNIHRRHPGNSQMLCKLAATHAPPRVKVKPDRLQPKKPPHRESLVQSEYASMPVSVSFKYKGRG